MKVWNFRCSVYRCFEFTGARIFCFSFVPENASGMSNLVSSCGDLLGF